MTSFEKVLLNKISEITQYFATVKEEDVSSITFWEFSLRLQIYKEIYELYKKNLTK